MRRAIPPLLHTSYLYLLQDITNETILPYQKGRNGIRGEEKRRNRENTRERRKQKENKESYLFSNTMATVIRHW